MKIPPVLNLRFTRLTHTQSANTSVFGTVAESMMMETWSGSRMRTSSQTTPRSASLM